MTMLQQPSKTWLLKDQLALFEKYAPLIGRTPRSMARNLDASQEFNDIAKNDSAHVKGYENEYTTDENVMQDAKSVERHLKFMKKGILAARQSKPVPSANDNGETPSAVVTARRIVVSPDRGRFRLDHGSPIGSPGLIPTIPIEDANHRLDGASDPSTSPSLSERMARRGQRMTHSAGKYRTPYSPSPLNQNRSPKSQRPRTQEAHRRDFADLAEPIRVVHDEAVHEKDENGNQSGEESSGSSSRKKTSRGIRLPKQPIGGRLKSPRVAKIGFPDNIADLLKYDPQEKNKILKNENASFKLTNAIIKAGELEIPGKVSHRDILGSEVVEIMHELTILLQTKLREQYDSMYYDVQIEERRHRKELERMKSSFEDKLFDALFKYEEMRKEVGKQERLEELLEAERRRATDMERRVVDYEDMRAALGILRNEVARYRRVYADMKEELARARDLISLNKAKKNGTIEQREVENTKLWKDLEEARQTIERQKRELQKRSMNDQIDTEAIRGFKSEDEEEDDYNQQDNLNEYVLTNNIVGSADVEIFTLEDDSSIRAPRLSAVVNRIKSTYSSNEERDTPTSSHDKEPTASNGLPLAAIGSPEMPSNFESERTPRARPEQEASYRRSSSNSSAQKTIQEQDTLFSAEMVQQFKGILTCPRCFERARHPMIVFDCEHNYCRDCSKIMAMQYHTSCLACDTTVKHDSPINNRVVLSLVKNVMIKTQAKLDLLPVTK